MDDQVRELVALGKDHFQRGDYSLAAGHLEQVVARGAPFADVHHMLGVVYHHLGEFESAQRSFQKALDINPPPSAATTSARPSAPSRSTAKSSQARPRRARASPAATSRSTTTRAAR